MKFGSFFLSGSVILGLLFIAGTAFAWSSPTQAPPGGNTPAPLNTGSATQVKSGILQTGDFGATSLTVGATANAGAVTSPQFCIAASCITSWAAITGAWATNGTSVYYNGGNVGIGNSGPSYKLDVSFASGNTIGARLLNGNNAYTSFGTDSSDNPIIIYGANGVNKTLSFQRSATLGATSGTNVMTLDGSGNVGIGTTPNAWGSTWKVLQVENTAFGNVADNIAVMAGNLYWDGAAYKYQSSNYGAFYTVNNVGAFEWYTAPSGTAGNSATVSLRMSLDNAGNLNAAGDLSASGQVVACGGGSCSHLRYAGSANYLRGNTYFNGLLYDENNPGYYLNPDSTSRLNYGVFDNVHAYGNICTSSYGCMSDKPNSLRWGATWQSGWSDTSAYYQNNYWNNCPGGYVMTGVGVTTNNWGGVWGAMDIINCQQIY